MGESGSALEVSPVWVGEMGSWFGLVWGVVSRAGGGGVSLRWLRRWEGGRELTRWRGETCEIE